MVYSAYTFTENKLSSRAVKCVDEGNICYITLASYKRRAVSNHRRLECLFNILPGPTPENF